MNAIHPAKKSQLIRDAGVHLALTGDLADWVVECYSEGLSYEQINTFLRENDAAILRAEKAVTSGSGFDQLDELERLELL